MFTKSREPNKNTNLHIRNIVQAVIEQTTPSLLVSKKNKEMMKVKETPMLDLNLLKNHLYNTFDLLLVKITLTEHISNLQNPVRDTVVEVHHVIVIQIAILHHKIDNVLTLETDTDIREVLLLHNLTHQGMTIIDVIHVLIIHHTDLLIDHHRDGINDLDTDHVHTLEIDHFHNLLRRIDILPNHKSSDLLDLDQVLRQKIKAIPFKQNNQIPLLIQIQLYHRTEMANTLTPRSWFCSL